MKNADGEVLHGLFQALGGAWKAVEGVEDSVHRASGLTSAQSKNISHLLVGGPMTISDLAFDRGVSRQSVQVAVNGLIESGYVRFEDNPRHRRAKLLRVTELGRERFEKARETENAIIKNVFSELPADDVKVATRILNNIREELAKPWKL